MNSLEKQYTDFYLKGNPLETYPNEYIVRIFMGSYPSLKLEKNYKGKKILDLGMGDGRNLRLMAKLGFEAFGVEVGSEVCKHVSDAFDSAGISVTIKTGKNDSIPFDDSTFDYLVSWNSSYYMGYEDEYDSYSVNVKEFSRVIAEDGKLIISVPLESNFIFENSEEIKPGYRKIVNDPYEIRNGHIFKCFGGRGDLAVEFSEHFTDFRFAELIDDCFGQKNHYLIMVCRKK